MNTIRQSHDNLFRKLLSNPEAARDFLRHRLPSPVLEKVDLESLQHEDPGKVSPSLKSSYFDVLLSLGMKKSKNRIYVGIEHQTREEPDIMFRMFENLSKLSNIPGQGSYIPLSLGLVVYSGKRPYKDIRVLNKLFGNEELAPLCPGLTYVIALNEERFEDIKKDGSAGLLTALIREGEAGGDFCGLVGKHDKWLGERLENCSEDELEAASAYMLGLDQHPEKLKKKLRKFGREIQNKMTNAALILEQRGVQIGERRGIRIGEQMGEEKGRIETARRLLSMKVPVRTIAQATDLSEEALAQLRSV